MPKQLPPEAFEADFSPGWDVSKYHYSPDDRERIERFIAEKVVVAEARRKRSLGR